MTNRLTTTPAARILLAAGITAFSFTAAQKPGINMAHLDTSYNPCNDFYHYCNGTWQKNFVLPGSDARFGSFNEINESNLLKIKAIYERALSTDAAPASDARRLRDFFQTAMDSSKADLLGFKPLTPQKELINRIKTTEDLMKAKATLELAGVNLFFTGVVSPDLRNSTKNRFNIYQGGYGLGDRDYYHNEAHRQIREEYKMYLKQLFVLSGVTPATAQQHATAVLDLETNLTEKALTRVQMRDIEKLHNPHSARQLQSLTPALNWKAYFGEKKITVPDTVNVAMTSYLRHLNTLIVSTPVEKLKIYAEAQLLMEAAPFLTDSAGAAHFSFRGRAMSGAQVQKARWQRVHQVVNSTIGEIVSREFVKEHFPPASKQKVEAMIDNLVAAYRERISTRDWMSEQTKKQANKKLDLLIRKVGYPDKWKDYKGLEIGTDNYWANICRVNAWLVQDNLSELGKPVDRMKWQMTPVTVNAYYDPTTNEITFPAAILQPPFFDPRADDAANYGTMGAIIGHELTHGFDDQGAQFDAQGNMKMWWTEEDYARFKEKTELIVRQFDSYIAIDTLRVNGRLTQGENIADLGGLTMAYYAYKKSLAGKPSPTIAGLSGEQRFFIAWAQGWKSKTRDEELKRLLTVDYHSPAYFRAFAPLTNMKEFHEAFGVKPGDKMHRPESDQVEIW